MRTAIRSSAEVSQRRALRRLWMRNALPWAEPDDMAGNGEGKESVVRRMMRVGAREIPKELNGCEDEREPAEEETSGGEKVTRRGRRASWQMD